jgi:hypothetical protein
MDDILKDALFPEKAPLENPSSELPDTYKWSTSVQIYKHEEAMAKYRVCRILEKLEPALLLCPVSCVQMKVPLWVTFDYAIR